MRVSEFMFGWLCGACVVAFAVTVTVIIFHGEPKIIDRVESLEKDIREFKPCK